STDAKQLLVNLLYLYFSVIAQQLLEFCNPGEHLFEEYLGIFMALELEGFVRTRFP
ncbi:unnamed protein product, partial [marine sediment metagenome]